MTTRICHESFVLEPDFSYPLYICANRYWGEDGDTVEAQAVTLLFLHSTSFHKETWEPTIQSLFDRLSRKRNHVRVQEMWAIECPNHGASALLNKEALQLPEYRSQFSCEKYTHAVHRFLNVGAKMQSRRLVGIGHSLGAIAMSFLQSLEPVISFQYIILVEPLISPKGDSHLLSLRTELMRGAYERRDVWATREEARTQLLRNPRIKAWSPLVFDCYVKYALRPEFPGSGSVTLCCSREEEATMYRDPDGATKFIPDLDKACARMPVHIIFGKVNDYMSREVQEAITDKNSPRHFASISRIDNAGHLVPQLAPEALADRIYNILNDSFSAPFVKL